MADPILHIKDSYYFEVPKKLWTVRYGDKSEYPALWVRLDDEYQSWEAGHRYDAYAELRSGESIGDKQDLIHEYLDWKHDHANAGKPFDMFLEQSHDPEFFARPEIQTSWAKWHGDTIEYNFQGYDWDTIEGWSNPGERAVWNLDVKQGGTYEVTIRYGCRFSDAGGKLAIRCGESSCELVTSGTPSAETFRTERAGTLDLAAGQVTLEAKALAVPGKELMRLNRIWLKRIDS